MFAMKYYLIFAITLISVFFSCKNEESPVRYLPPQIKDEHEFTKTLPRSGWPGRFRHSYYFAQKFTANAGLPVIENGVDSFHTRLWYVYNDSIIQVTDILYNKQSWDAVFYSLKGRKNGDSTQIYISEEIHKQPKSGWNNFIDRFLALGIKSLPQQSTLAVSEKLAMDGDFVIVEFSTSTTYRLYSYSCPNCFLDSKENTNMENIMKLIEKEFNAKRFRKF